MNAREQRLGIFSSLPLSALLLLTFIAPLLAIAAFSIMPAKVFTLAHIPDFSAYGEFFRQGYWKSLAWSLGMAAVATGFLLVICWPLAYGMVRVFKRFTLIMVITVLIVVTLMHVDLDKVMGKGK